MCVHACLSFGGHKYGAVGFALCGFLESGPVGLLAISLAAAGVMALEHFK